LDYKSNHFLINSAFVNTLELSNPKVLIRSDQARKAKGKNVIIREQRHDERQPLEVIPKVSATSTLGGQDKIKTAGTASTGPTSLQTGLTGAPDQSDWCLHKGSKSCKPKKKQGQVLMSSWPNIRGKELLRIKVISQTVLRV
jgi:hypothetical protein